MWNKLFWKNNNITSEDKNETLLSKVSGFSKKVLKQLRVAPLAVAGILAWCTTTSDNNQVDIEENLDNTNWSYTLQVENNKNIDLDKQATVEDVLSALWPVIVKDEFWNEISNTIEKEEVIEYKEFHIAKKWEWFHSIARHYNIDPYELIELNRPYLDNVDIIPLDYKVKLWNLVPLNSIDNNSSITENQDYSLLSQAETQVSDVNVSIQWESIELTQTQEVDSTIENETLNKTKTYEVLEDENLYKIAWKVWIPFVVLKEYNKHLRRYDEKTGVYMYVVYPTKKIFLQEPDMDSKEDLAIISDYNNHVADINNYIEWKNNYQADYDRGLWYEIVDAREEEFPVIESEELWEYRKHRIVSWDNLTFIAGRYNVTVWEIVTLNWLDKNKFLQEGKVLKIPQPNKNLASHNNLTKQEQRKQFFVDVRNYIANIPGFLYELDTYIYGDNYSEDKFFWLTYDSNTIKYDYLIEQLYNLPNKEKNSFIARYIHPKTLDSESVYWDLNNRRDQTQCWAAMRDILRIAHNDTNVNSSWMDANKYVPYFENSQDYIAVRINSIYDIQPWAALVYDPGYWVWDRFKVWHVEYYVWEHDGQNRFAHITSKKYWKTYPYPWGSLNGYVQEAWLRNIVYYHRSLFDSSYVNTNMTKTEYLAYQKTQWQENIANAQITPKEEVVIAKKHIETFTQLWPTIQNANIVLNQLFMETENPIECLTSFSHKCIDVLRKQKAAWLKKEDPVVQKYFNYYRNSEKLIKHAEAKANEDWIWVLRAAE